MNITHETGYEKIERALRLDRVLSYEDILVTIRVNSSIMVELLSPDPMGVSNWIWENDWWGGEEDVQLIGAQYMSDTAIIGNRLLYKG